MQICTMTAKMERQRTHLLADVLEDEGSAVHGIAHGARHHQFLLRGLQWKLKGQGGAVSCRRHRETL